MSKKIYLVKQTQWNYDSAFEDIYKDTTIYACSDENKAVDKARKLNDQYACGVSLTDDNDFLYIIDEAEDIHYYDVEAIEIDEELA